MDAEEVVEAVLTVRDRVPGNEKKIQSLIKGLVLKNTGPLFFQVLVR